MSDTKERNETVTITCHQCHTKTEIKANTSDLNDWCDGKLIQDACPYLNATERELLISQMCGNCFDEMYGFCSDDHLTSPESLVN
jgi:hypothetical protein